ncbi:V-type proton ATPase subunit E [Glomus cerebriforme]|uniref:V-type proton ATPase subunit E n=1 Tax=Glomus cerebriforme TaxID=658196 RepID=A0A397TLM1_9GLOM|nr:V-type proton ATPase subunit E [Glomus cerebriforme]
MSGFNIVWVGCAIAGLVALSYIVVPKGPNQTTIRTSLILSFICTYLMWAITYLSQLHPLIVPRRNAGEH